MSSKDQDHWHQSIRREILMYTCSHTVTPGSPGMIGQNMGLTRRTAVYIFGPTYGPVQEAA